MIELKDLSFCYETDQQTNCLKNINLTIEEGEVVLICGESGCGKTTILRDIIRHISYGIGCVPLKVAIVDERSEIASPISGERMAHQIPARRRDKTIQRIYFNLKCFYSITSSLPLPTDSGDRHNLSSVLHQYYQS